MKSSGNNAIGGVHVRIKKPEKQYLTAFKSSAKLVNNLNKFNNSVDKLSKTAAGNYYFIFG